MQKASEPVIVGSTLQDLHDKHVLVRHNLCLRVEKRHLVLGRGNLVMLGFDLDIKGFQLLVDILHKTLDVIFNLGKVLVLELLRFRWCAPE